MSFISSTSSNLCIVRELSLFLVLRASLFILCSLGVKNLAHCRATSCFIVSTSRNHSYPVTSCPNIPSHCPPLHLIIPYILGYTPRYFFFVILRHSLHVFSHWYFQNLFLFFHIRNVLLFSLYSPPILITISRISLFLI